jgi:hypothetical protein
MLIILLQALERIGSPVMGILIPGLILLLSIVLTWMLYIRFSEKK